MSAPSTKAATAAASAKREAAAAPYIVASDAATWAKLKRSRMVLSDSKDAALHAAPPRTVLRRVRPGFVDAKTGTLYYDAFKESVDTPWRPLLEERRKRLPEGALMLWVCLPPKTLARASGHGTGATLTLALPDDRAKPGAHVTVLESSFDSANTGTERGTGLVVCKIAK